MSRTSDHAVFRYGAGNVLLHLTFAALTLIVSGLFVFPWIVWANTIREHRVTVRVEADRGVVPQSLTGSGQVARGQLVEHALEHAHGVLRGAATDDKCGERHVAAVAGEP